MQQNPSTAMQKSMQDKKTKITLPQPHPDALKHSQKLTQAIIQNIQQNHGKISFEEFMQQALYAPGLGYYSAGSQKFGAEGDFITAPEISPLFSQVLAIQIQQVFKLIQDNDVQTDILEFGAGSGKMALDIILELNQRDALPQHYYILDLSADLIQRQQNFLKEELKKAGIPSLFEKFTWLDKLPKTFDGVILANEVLDAMPVKLMKSTSEALYERFIGEKEGQFHWIDVESKDPDLFAYQQKINFNLEHKQLNTQPISTISYITEINSTAKHWIKSLANCLNKGNILLIDYGYTEAEYLHPQRSMGTLMCHYRHHSHDDPFYLPGLQDITAHVNFSDIKEAALNNGLQVDGFSTQAHFLISGGLDELTQHLDVNDTISFTETTRQIKMLTLPNEMGELFKVMCLSKANNTASTLSGFNFINIKEKL